MKPFLHLILWAVVLAAALTGYGAWYRVIAQKSVAVVALENEINARTETADRIASARATLAEIADDEALVESYFVPEARIVPFISDLEDRAKIHGAALKVRSVSTAGSAKQPVLILSIGIDGSFDAVMRTIGAIEYAPYQISVSKLSVGKSGKEEWYAGVELTVGSVPSTATSTEPAAKVISHISP